MTNESVALVTGSSRGIGLGIAEHLLREGKHGDLPRWQEILDGLPDAGHHFDGTRAAPVLGNDADNTDDLAARLIKLHPWRKGPVVTES